MGIWSKITGFINDSFKLGFTGPTLKKDSSENDQLNIRNNADSADGKLKVGTTKTTNLEINSTDAYKTVISMQTGAAGDLVFKLPNTDGNSGDHMATDGAGNLTWTPAGGASANTVYDYEIAYDSGATTNLVNMAANSWVDQIIVDVTTAFDGTDGNTLEIGVTGETSKFVPITDVNLTTAGTYILDVAKYQSTSAQMIATFSAATSGATAGAATIICKVSVPE